ncbi:MAG: hypothetical protein AAFR61_08560 [Bacteroidota bacterium]
MKRIILIASLLLALGIDVRGQEAPFVKIDSVINGISFNRLKVENLVYADGALYLDLNMNRRGAMQNVNGSVRTGGKEWTNLPARYLVKYQPGLDKAQEEFFFYKPRGTGRVAYLDQPFSVSKSKVLAQPDKISTAEGGGKRVNAFIPEGEAMPAPKKEKRPKIVQVGHWQNSLPLTPKGVKKIKVKRMEPGQYGFDKKSVKEFDLTNDQIGLKADQSLAFSTGFLTAEDKINGHRFGLFGIKTKKDKSDGEFHNQLLFMVDSEGKAKHEVIKSEKPMIGVEALPIYEEVPQDPKPLEMILFLHRETKRKSNPKPDRTNHRLLAVNAQGEVLQNSTFKVLATQMKWLKSTPLPGGKFLMVGAGMRPGGISYYTFDQKGLVNSEIIDEQHPLYKNAKITRGMTFYFAEGTQKTLPDGSVLFFDRLQHRAQTQGTLDMTYYDYGRFYMKIDPAGKMVGALGIPRPKGVSTTKAANEVTLIKTDTREVYYERGAASGNGYKGQLVSINLETLEAKIIPLKAGKFTTFTNLAVDQKNGAIYATFINPARPTEVRIAQFSF